MSHDLWRWSAWVLVAASLTGCSSVSQKWSQWRGKGDNVSAAAQAPAALRPTTETARWQGVYSYEADSGRFQDCQSGQTVPVLMEGDSALLENAYMASRNGPAVAMLAAVDGRIVERAVSDPVLAQQGKKELALRIDRFVSLSSATSCAGDKAKGLGVPVAVVATDVAASTGANGGAAAPVPQKATPSANATLENTYWKLVTLHGKAVARSDKEAHLILQSQGKLAGSGGCNRLMGSWSQQGDALTVRQVATTRMACKGSAATTEAALLKALERVAQWRIHGEQLELLDAKGKLLAQLQAVALK